MPLFTAQNPLLVPPLRAATSLDTLAAKTIHRRKLATGRRELRDARRFKTAAEAVGPIDREREIYGFTNGQFGTIDLINHCLGFTGPAFLSIFTWTVSTLDATDVLALIDSGKVTGSRWVIDYSFNRRKPEVASQLRTALGNDAIRVAAMHAKFFMLGNKKWKIVCRTSMNLNFNPRFENFELAHDPSLFDFHQAIFDEIWKQQSRSLFDSTPAKHKYFPRKLAQKEGP